MNVFRRKPTPTLHEIVNTQLDNLEDAILQKELDSIRMMSDIYCLKAQKFHLQEWKMSKHGAQTVDFVKAKTS